MTDKVFTQPECGIYFNDKFINLKIDMESEPGKIIKEKYRIESYPTFLLLDQNGIEINRIVGRSATTSEFIAKVEKALLGKIDPQPLLDAFNSSPTADNFCKYLLLLADRGEFKQFESFLNESFDRLPFPDKFSSAIGELILKYTLMLHDTESFYFRFIENNKVYADEYIGKTKVNEIIGMHLPVTVEYRSRQEAASLVDLSKLPDNASETLRIVKVGDYDACACAGDHVKNTEEVAPFKIISADFSREEGNPTGRWRMRFKLIES